MELGRKKSRRLECLEWIITWISCFKSTFVSSWIEFWFANKEPKYLKVICMKFLDTIAQPTAGLTGDVELPGIVGILD